MTLDTTTLRVAFSVSALALLVLFYFVTFRSTRSAYSAWWCAALGMFLSGSAAYLLNGTVHQQWANPLGNVLLVAGTVCVWAGARSLRGKRAALWQLTAGPALTAAASVLDNPSTNTWSGGAVLLALMGLMLAFASRELWRLDAGYSRVHRTMALVSAAVAVYYLCRCIAYVADGPDGAVFTTYFGTEVTTVATMVLLVGVSFSMTSLSNEQLTRELRAHATQDGLTGLYNRSGFWELAKKRTAAYAPYEHFRLPDPR